MSRSSVFCPNGHRWEVDDEARSVCPVCGLGADATAVAPREDDKPEIDTALELTATLDATRDVVERTEQPSPDPLARTETVGKPEGVDAPVPRELPALAGYRVLGTLGTGGVGTVLRARDPRLGRDVALKFLRDDGADPGRLERFAREARITSALNHPHICTVYDIGEHEGRPYIVMELVEGRTLRELAAQRPPLAEWVRIVGQVARALAAAHAAGVIHRDIKPENVMVRDDGYVKVVDFGIARRVPPGTDARPAAPEQDAERGALLGTVRYMSPEQAARQPVGSPSDVFSLGILLYEMVTGTHPFPAATTRAVLAAIRSEDPPDPSLRNPDVPAALGALILQMLQKTPGTRPTAAEVGAFLYDLAAHGWGRSRPTLAPVTRHAVGRRHELGALLDGFSRAAAGGGMWLGVAGEAGMGKTTLVEEFLASLADDGQDFGLARGRCSERLAGTEAYLPLLEALETFVRGRGGEAAACTLKLLAPTWYTQIGPLAGESSSYLRDSAAARASSQERMKRELVALLSEWTSARPLVLFLDDMHWADASTLDFLHYLGVRGAPRALLVILTYRPSELESSPRPLLRVKLELQARGVWREVTLSFLSREEIERYLALEFPENEFPERFAALLHGRTEGNPLFLVDLTRYLRARGIISQVAGRWSLAERLLDLGREFPESVLSMVRKKVGQLDEADRRLLAVASVQGVEFDTVVPATILGLDPADVEDRLETLGRAHALVRLAGEHVLPDQTFSSRYRFVHALYQNVLFDQLTPARRAAYSAAVAETMLRLHAGRSAPVATRVAILFESARQYGRSAAFFLEAARRELKVFADEEAIALARRGLEAVRHVTGESERLGIELGLQITLGVPLGATRGWAAAETEHAYRRAYELCRRIGDVPELFAVLWGLWVFHLVRAELTEARDAATRLLDFGRNRADPAAMIVAHTELGYTLGHLGEFRAAVTHLEQVGPLHRAEYHAVWAALNPVDPTVASACLASRFLWVLGEDERALERARWAIDLARTLANPHNLAFALVFGAIVHQLRGDLDETRAHTEAALAVAVEHGLADVLGLGTVWQGWARVMSGAADGLEPMRQALAGMRMMGAEILRPHALGLLAEACGRLGEFAVGLDALTEALGDSERTGNRYYESELHRLRGELLRAQSVGDDPAADASFRRAIEVAHAQGARAFEERATQGLARSARARGEAE